MIDDTNEECSFYFNIIDDNYVCISKSDRIGKKNMNKILGIKTKRRDER